MMEKKTSDTPVLGRFLWAFVSTALFSWPVLVFFVLCPEFSSCKKTVFTLFWGGLFLTFVLKGEELGESPLLEALGRGFIHPFNTLVALVLLLVLDFVFGLRSSLGSLGFRVFGALLWLGTGAVLTAIYYPFAKEKVDLSGIAI